MVGSGHPGPAHLVLKAARMMLLHLVLTLRRMILKLRIHQMMTAMMMMMI
jgi:hypothetical protein